jgi:DNA (cytosine-5)-methyltransferase 1
MGVLPTRPTEQLELGEVGWLRFDAGTAAAHWGVENPIGRRDKKSGDTKRKQADIERSLRLFAAE